MTDPRTNGAIISLDKSQSKLSFDAKKERQEEEGFVGNLIIAK